MQSHNVAVSSARTRARAQSIPSSPRATGGSSASARTAQHGYRRRGLTRIDVCVTVVVAALVCVLLGNSLHAGRQATRKTLCVTNLRQFAGGLVHYVGQYGSFPPCDPHPMMHRQVPGIDTPRGGGPDEKMDPAHGWLAFYGLDIRPELPAESKDKPWESVPFGFNRQAKAAPDTLWGGFLCPDQNRFNTTDPKSPELDANEHHECQATHYKYASGYMVNRLLRSATTLKGKPGARWSAWPDDAFEATFAADSGPYDNIYGACSIHLDKGKGLSQYHVQAIHPDEVFKADDVMVMADSLDHHTRNSTPTRPEFAAGQFSAGMWTNPYQEDPNANAVILGARHRGAANVLYVDGHVSQDNQIPRNRRGDTVIASTFADYTAEHHMGSLHHLLPSGRNLNRPRAATTGPATTQVSP